MKKLLALALALVLTLAFTGCHGTLSSGENPAASSSYPVPDEFDTSRRMAPLSLSRTAIPTLPSLWTLPTCLAPTN